MPLTEGPAERGGPRKYFPLRAEETGGDVNKHHISAELGTKKWESRLLLPSCFTNLKLKTKDTQYLLYSV